MMQLSTGMVMRSQVVVAIWQTVMMMSNASIACTYSYSLTYRSIGLSVTISQRRGTSPDSHSVPCVAVVGAMFLHMQNCFSTPQRGQSLSGSVSVMCCCCSAYPALRKQGEVL
jgi:hypothetical protein